MHALTKCWLRSHHRVHKINNHNRAEKKYKKIFSSCILSVVKKKMKRKRKYITHWFLLVCMVMQIASVFPHHHHSELFCLHADLATCAGEDCNTAGMHHEGDGDRHTCTVGCVTQFQCATTGHHQDTVAPDYTFYSFLYTFAYLLHFGVHARSDFCFPTGCTSRTCTRRM